MYDVPPLHTSPTLVVRATRSHQQREVTSSKLCLRASRGEDVIANFFIGLLAFIIALLIADLFVRIIVHVIWPLITNFAVQ